MMEMPKIWDLFKEELAGLFSKKAAAVLVVDIGSDLKLLNVQLKDGIKVSSVKIVGLAKEKKEEIILNSLRNFIQANNILHKNAVLKPCLPSLFIKRIRLPAIPEAELSEAIKLQIREELAFDLSAALVDFSVIKETSAEDGTKTLDIICVAAQEQEVREQVLLLRQAGLNCSSVIPLPFGYSRLAEKFLLEAKDDSVCILHMEEEACFLSIHKDNKLEFYRQIPVSIGKLRDGLKCLLVSDKCEIELSADEADEVLFNIGIPQEGAVYKDKLKSFQILPLLRPNLERLIQEIKRSLAYYESQFRQKPVSRVVLAGPVIRIPNIEKFLYKELAPLDVTKISLADKIIASKGAEAEALAVSYADFGLAIDYEKGINLLPYEFRTEKIEKFQKISIRWLAFIAFLLLVFSYIFARVGIQSYRKRLDNASMYLNVLSEVKQAKMNTAEFNNFINDIMNSGPPVSVMLKKISNIAGRDLFLDSFSLDCDSRTVTLSGMIKSRGQNQDSVLTKFVRDMEGTSYFTDASIVSVDKIKQEDINILKFNVTFKLP